MCVFVLPHTSFASSLWYGNIVKVNGDNIILEWRGLENKNYFSCSIETQACSALPGLPLASSLSSQSFPVVKSLVKFPSNSVRQNLSGTGRFGFYTTVSTLKKTRTIGLIDGQKKKSYSIGENLAFWNLFEEQPHLSHFASDDSTLTYLSDRSGFASLYIVPLNNISQKNFQQGLQITSGVSVGDFIYANSQTILYVANTKIDPYNWILYSYNLATKTKSILAEHLVYDTVLHQSGNSIIFTEITPLGTSPVVLTNFQGGKVKEFTLPISAPPFTNSIIYTYQRIAGADTVEMKSKNTTAGKHTLIVWLHGGPYRQGSLTRHPYISYGVYDWILEEAVNQGAYVLKIDYPGSYGSGRKFTESIKGGVGIVDVKSVMNVITAFSKTYEVSEVYTLGNSYGGYLALKSMSVYPSKISGAFSINGVTDWSALVLYYKTSIFNTFFNGLPSTNNKKLFTQASIINNIKQIKNPLYIIQSESDTTIPKSQAILLKNALDNANKTSTLIFIPSENHVFLKDSSINTICKALFEMTHLNVTNSCNLEG